MRIYIAGPYTQGDVAQNVKTAISEGDYLARFGHVVFIPHLTHFWHMVHAHEYEFWMNQDLAWLEVCDAVLRLPGESQGADREVEAAKAAGKPIYYSVFEVTAKAKKAT